MCIIRQLLVKFKKILSKGFRATLNVWTFEFALTTPSPQPTDLFLNFAKNCALIFGKLTSSIVSSKLFSMAPLDTKHEGLIKKILLCSSAQPIFVGTGTKLPLKCKKLIIKTMQIRLIFRQKTIVWTVSDFSIVNINTVIIASLESKKKNSSIQVS